MVVKRRCCFFEIKSREEGVAWKDFAVTGGGGENAMTVLKSRAVSEILPQRHKLRVLTFKSGASWAS